MFPFINVSCLCRYLIGQGANVGVVNSEGETPLDIAEEEAMEELLQNEINRQGTAAFPWHTLHRHSKLHLSWQWFGKGLHGLVSCPRRHAAVEIIAFWRFWVRVLQINCLARMAKGDMCIMLNFPSCCVLVSRLQVLAGLQRVHWLRINIRAELNQ